MKEFVRRQTDDRLRNLAAQIDRAAEDGGPDAVHDLRVAIRRLSRCLRAFAAFYPGRTWKHLRVELSELLHAAGQIRDRDIALEMLAKARVGRRSAIVVKLEAERTAAHAGFVAEVRHWRDRKAVQKWGRRLEVSR
jgi:CHAD domain-containing protein